LVSLVCLAAAMCVAWFLALGYGYSCVNGLRADLYGDYCERLEVFPFLMTKLPYLLVGAPLAVLLGGAVYAVRGGRAWLVVPMLLGVGPMVALLLPFYLISFF